MQCRMLRPTGRTQSQIWASTMYGFVSESGAQSAADVWQAPRGPATRALEVFTR